MARVLITTVPFGSADEAPLNMLRGAGVEFTLNPYQTKLTPDQLKEIIGGYDALIAGTENITAEVLEKATDLRLIARVGIGLDSVDLIAAKNRGVEVSYTPDAPSPAVAELTVGSILSLLRAVHVSNINMHNGKWHRYFGRRLSKVTVGVIGIGRIGTLVCEFLTSMGVGHLMVNDLENKTHRLRRAGVEWASKSDILKNADVVTIHVPLSDTTKNLITKTDLRSMKSDAILINTSRGGVVNELDLFEVMQSGHLSGAAIDVFETEPYDGDLKKIDRCLLTAHMGSMSEDCRSQMEIEATQEVIRFFENKKLLRPVPSFEIENQRLAWSD